LSDLQITSLPFRSGLQTGIREPPRREFYLGRISQGASVIESLFAEDKLPRRQFLILSRQ
jgi:hypothetical protein